MKITVASPRRPSSGSGNDVTSARWGRRLRELGHDVAIATVVESDQPLADSRDDVGDGSDLLVALHARRCGSAVAASRRHAPQRPIVVGLAGTDLYRDLPDDSTARWSIDVADQLVVLQEAAVDRLADMHPSLAHKAHVVYQSVEPPIPDRVDPSPRFVVMILAHLREVKDPLLAAKAARLVPRESRLEIIHAGHASDDEWHQRATAEEALNPRYHWLGELDRPNAMEQLANSTLLACTSQLEGGANVVTEAIALGVPVVGTEIDGNTGLLGAGYPGLVPVGDEAALAEWLWRLESEREVLADLTERIGRRHLITEPATERAGWQAVLEAI